jgi:hypothetical protein
MAINKEFIWGTKTFKIDIYIHSDGKKMILRNCQQNIFYLIYFSKETSLSDLEKRTLPEELKPFAEKAEKLNDDGEYKYRVLGEIALNRLSRYMVDIVSISFGGEWSYDNKNDIVKWSSGSDKAEYHLAYWTEFSDG